MQKGFPAALLRFRGKYQLTQVFQKRHVVIFYGYPLSLFGNNQESGRRRYLESLPGSCNGSSCNIYHRPYKIPQWGSSCHGAADMNPTSIHEDVGSIPGFAQWVGIWRCRDLWYRSQMQAGSHSSGSIPSLGTSTYHGCGPKKPKKKKKKKKRKKKKYIYSTGGTSSKHFHSSHRASVCILHRAGSSKSQLTHRERAPSLCEALLQAPYPQ